MKLLKTLTIGALLAATPAVVNAQTILHIAGSTAYRTAASSAIAFYLNGTGNKQVHVAYANNGGPVKNNYAIYSDGAVVYNSGVYSTASFTNGSGASIPAATTIIETNWTGSASGVLDLTVQNVNVGFLNLTDGTNTPTLNNSVLSVGTGGITDSGTGLVSGKLSNTSPNFSTTNAPEVVFSDSFATSVASALSTANVTAQPGTIPVSPLSGAGLASAINSAAANRIAEAGTTSVVSAGSASGYLGIVPFAWVVGNLGAPSSGTGGQSVIPFSNITTRTVQFITANGYAPFTLFSSTALDGSSNDAHAFVYLIGRNEDSGTRIDAYAEGQEGFTKNPKQLLLSFHNYVAPTAYPPPSDYVGAPYGIGGGGSNYVTDVQLWPSNATLNTESSINWSSAGGGHSGYAGGGDLTKVLSTAVNQTSLQGSSYTGFASQNTGNTYFIGYVSIADAGGFVAPSSSTIGGSNSPSSVANGVTLTFNGVPFSFNNVTDGAYSFWSYEHEYYLTSGTGAIGTSIPTNGVASQKTIADTVANNIATTYANYTSGGVAATNGTGAGVPLPSSNVGEVSLTIEGGPYTLATY